jgi:putative MATE family efflux protein
MYALAVKAFGINKILKKTQPLGEMPSGDMLLRETLRIAWPSTLEAFLLAMISFIDVLMISSWGDYAVAAVGLTTQPRLVCIVVFTALQPAVSALVARRKGEGDRDGANRVTKMALLACVALIAVISALSVAFAGDIMRFAGSGENTHGYAVGYFRITMGAMCFNAFTMVINAAQRGAGNTRVAMVTNITSNAVNVVFNALLIGSPGGRGLFGLPALGVDGAAIATVTGQAVAFVMAVASVMHSDGFICVRRSSGRLLERRSAGALARIGAGALAEQLIFRGGILVYAIIVAGLGELQFATHNIAMNFMTISFSFGDGLSIAAVALVGHSLGKKRGDIAKIYGALCQRLGLVCSAVLGAVYILFGRGMFALFSQNERVLRDGAVIMLLMTGIVLFQISQVIFSGCLRGSGDVRFVALTAFVGIGVLRPVLAYLLSTTLGLGVVGAWAGIIIDQVIRLSMTAARFFKGGWTKIKI